jgi:hypothetical protein
VPLDVRSAQPIITLLYKKSSFKTFYTLASLNSVNFLILKGCQKLRKDCAKLCNIVINYDCDRSLDQRNSFTDLDAFVGN